MSVRRTLPTRADGKADDRYKGTKPKAPAKPIAIDDGADLDGLDAAALKEIAEKTALKTLIVIARSRNPGRHAGTRASSARNLMDFSSAKPAAVQTFQGADGGAIQSEHRIVFVAPKTKP